MKIKPNVNLIYLILAKMLLPLFIMISYVFAIFSSWLVWTLSN
jgi:hypothetical protein